MQIKLKNAATAIKNIAVARNQEFFRQNLLKKDLLVAINTGLRLSELTNIKWENVVIQGAGAHIRVVGKGRKERCTPLTKRTVAVLEAWKAETSNAESEYVFPMPEAEN